MKRLYEVTCSFTYYAYTDNSRGALDCIDEVLRDISPFEITDDAEVVAVSHAHHHMRGVWDENCLVYGTEEDLALGDALKMLPERGVK